MQRFQDNPKQGPALLNKLNLWRFIVARARSNIHLNNELAYNFTYLILHGACNQKQFPLPAEISDLLHTLLVSFNRISEDLSLTFKPRLSKYRI